MTTEEIRNILSDFYIKYQEYSKVYAKKAVYDNSRYRYKYVKSPKYIKLELDCETRLSSLKEQILPLELKIEEIIFEIVKKYVSTLDTNLNFEHVEHICNNRGYSLFPSGRRYQNFFGKWKPFDIYYNSVSVLFDEKLYNDMFFNGKWDNSIFVLGNKTFKTEKYKKAFYELISKFEKIEMPKFKYTDYYCEEPWERIDTSIYARYKECPDEDKDYDGGFDPGIG